MAKQRVVVLASGQGSNFQAIAEEIQGPLRDHFELCGLLCDRKEAFVLNRAQALGVAHEVIQIGSDFSPLLSRLIALAPDWICLAGFMRVLPVEIVEHFPNRMINLHPSLLPAFPGMHALERAFEHGVKWTGCTLHVVDSGVDTGPILAQKVVEILPEDDLESLRGRIQAAENRIFVEILRKLAFSSFVVEKRRVLWLTQPKCKANFHEESI